MIHVVIVAAGSGTRFGGDIPKQFRNLNGRPVVMTTIEAFRRAVPDGIIRLVISESMTTLWNDLAREHGFESPLLVTGGATRFDSVKNAVDSIAAGKVNDGDIILVHDGARPLVNREVIEHVIEGVRTHSAAVPVIAVTDSIREVTPDGTSRPVDRGALRAVQTPQGFDARLLIEAYARPYNPLFTDDASVVEATGATVSMVEGHPENIKITNRGDLAVATALSASRHHGR